MLEGPKPTPKFVYDLEDSLEEKVNKIVKTIYGGDGVIFTDKAKKQIKQLADWGLNRLPVCMAKTQYSLSDNPALLGAQQALPSLYPISALLMGQALSYAVQVM